MDLRIWCEKTPDSTREKCVSSHFRRSKKILKSKKFLSSTCAFDAIFGRKKGEQQRGEKLKKNIKKTQKMTGFWGKKWKKAEKLKKKWKKWLVFVCKIVKNCTPDTQTFFNVKIGNLSGPFAQLLRYTAPADARSTIVRLRSAGTAGLALDQNSALR